MNKADTVVSDSAGTHASQVHDDENYLIKTLLKNFFKLKQ